MDLGRVVASGSPAELKEGLGGDVVELRASRPEELVERVEQAFGLSPTLLEGGLILRAPRAHELVPRLVEAFDAGRLDSISVRSPGLADVFLQVTGRRLGGEEGS